MRPSQPSMGCYQHTPSCAYGAAIGTIAPNIIPHPPRECKSNAVAVFPLGHRTTIRAELHNFPSPIECHGLKAGRPEPEFHRPACLQNCISCAGMSPPERAACASWGKGQSLSAIFASTRPGNLHSTYGGNTAQIFPGLLHTALRLYPQGGMRKTRSGFLLHWQRFSACTL